jgi:glyoxylase-like metal-dependent hydrolase (beta-lactamase superfamily II)|tara:strand:+ start:581 stop:1249 length:669 start_codon:yes stop_codon:yes gene_type:complete
VEWRIASIGTLASNPLWDECGAPRTGHATTTIIKSNGAVLLVDPSLPAQIMNARLHERWGMNLSDITHVFLTSFDPDRRRTLEGLEQATWYMSEPEIESAATAIQDELYRCEEDVALTEILERHKNLLHSFTAAEDHLFDGVDLFPLPGYTPGSCGLLLPTPKRTVLICGDTVATQEHLVKGMVLANSSGIELAQESFKECIEIADIIIPGRDNVLLNPIRS